MARQSTITTEVLIGKKAGTDGTMLPHGLRLAFDNGKVLELFIGQLDEATAQQALVHGLKQKLVDAAAISRNTDTGRAASTDDKYAAVKEVYDRLLAGQWNKGREGGGAGGSGGLLFRALCRMYEGKKTPEQIRAYLDGLDDKQQAALRGNGKVAQVIAEIRASQAKPDVDTDSLLGELEGDE